MHHKEIEQNLSSFDPEIIVTSVELLHKQDE